MEKQIFTQSELQEKLLPIIRQQGILYKKFKKVYAKKADGGEKISTITNDGKETENIAKSGDFIIQNQTGAGEKYIVPAHKFLERYIFHKENDNDFDEFEPTGTIIAIELTTEFLLQFQLNNQFYFMANWGTEMITKKGDFLVAPPDFSEIYRIARKEFFETYILG